MKQIAEWISTVIASNGKEETLKSVQNQVHEVCKNFPIYQA